MNKSTKKRVIITIAVCLALWVASYFIGYYVVAEISYNLTEGIITADSLVKQIDAILLYSAPVLFVIQLLFTAFYCLYTYFKAKGIHARWDGEDEETIDKAEKLMSGCTAVMGVAQIVSMVLFGVIVYCTYDKFYSDFIFWMFMAFAVAFMAENIFIVVMQRSAVQLIKKMNPEKRGEVLDIKFAKDWEKSMDEAQKAIAFECDYRAYKVCIYTCLILWLVCLMGIFFGMGLMPLVMVSVVWLATSVTYLVKAYKMEHKKRSIE